MIDEIDYKKLYEQELRKNQFYEQHGSAKLYYSLQRKMNEMADMLNSNSLSSINLDDPKDKSFDRIFKLLEKSETVANSAKVLGDTAGITGDEEKDIMRKQRTSPESIAHVLGNTAGQQD